MNTHVEPSPSPAAGLWSVKLACGVTSESAYEQSELDKGVTLCGVHEKLEKIVSATELAPPVLFVLVGCYQGLPSEVSLHFDGKKAEAAFLEYTGFPYPKPGHRVGEDDENWNDDYDGSEIHAVHLTLAEAATYFAEVLHALDQVPGGTERFGAMLERLKPETHA